MARPHNPDMGIYWKVLLPAAIAGRVEFLLLDPVHQKPTYGSRAKLLAKLLEAWVAAEEGTPIPHVPTAAELRSSH